MPPALLNSKTRLMTMLAITAVARPDVVNGVAGNAIRSRATGNVALGGPTTLDARKLVRR
jgi:hypothetical protein